MNPLYESFNARNHTPAQVAATFIRNADYELLWRNEHTVVLGPRGSGKTTLFKMLTVQALHESSDPFVLDLRKRRPFTAVYVPTDMHWHHQLRHADKLLGDAPVFAAAASRAAVTTSVLLAIVRAFKERLKFEIAADEQTAAKLCSSLIFEWRLAKTLPGLEMIALSLKARISEIRRIINREIFARANDDSVGDVPDYFHLDYLASLDFACSAFDTMFGLPDTDKWALCFDELELAPLWLQTLALSQQRSSEDKYLIKVSTSPLPSVLGTTDAQPKQDVRLISIWNYSGRSNDDFAERLANATIQRRLRSTISPRRLLGNSELQTDDDEPTAKYSKGSPEWKLFREVAEWDPGLRNLFERVGIDPTNPVTDDIYLRDTLLRKAKPVAMLRQAFLKPAAGGTLTFRTRKLSSLYFGRETIYKMADGNPRRLIGLLGDLCERAKSSAPDAKERLSPNEQAEILSRASKHFLGYVHALPGGTAHWGEHRLDLVTLLKTIATHFRQRLLGREFPLDPVGSFIVDSNLDDRIVELLRLAVYHGAIVHVDPVPDTIETSLRGKRFRLSYMLSPGQRLPLTLSDPVSLTSILRNSARLRVRRILPAMVTPELRLEFGS